MALGFHQVHAEAQNPRQGDVHLWQQAQIHAASGKLILRLMRVMSFGSMWPPKNTDVLQYILRFVLASQDFCPTNLHGTLTQFAELIIMLNKYNIPFKNPLPGSARQ